MVVRRRLKAYPKTDGFLSCRPEQFCLQVYGSRLSNPRLLSQSINKLRIAFWSSLDRDPCRSRRWKLKSSASQRMSGKCSEELFQVEVWLLNCTVCTANFAVAKLREVRPGKDVVSRNQQKTETCWKSNLFNHLIIN